MFTYKFHVPIPTQFPVEKTGQKLAHDQQYNTITLTFIISYRRCVRANLRTKLPSI